MNEKKEPQAMQGPDAGTARRKRTGVDRRSGDDRRKVYDFEYFEKGGPERRAHKGDRRRETERRKGWVRVTQWSSVYVGERAAEKDKSRNVQSRPRGGPSA